jgi:hypothetical protein
MAGLVPAIPIIKRCLILIEDRRDKPGDDATGFAPLTKTQIKTLKLMDAFEVSCPTDSHPG